MNSPALHARARFVSASELHGEALQEDVGRPQEGVGLRFGEDVGIDLAVHVVDEAGDLADVAAPGRP